VEELTMVFVDAPTDMAMAQVVPVFDWFRTISPVMTQYDGRATRTGRVLWRRPAVQGVDAALESPTGR
jgi:hypothetical protein